MGVDKFSFITDIGAMLVSLIILFFMLCRQREFINCCWYLNLDLNFILLGFAAFCH